MINPDTELASRLLEHAHSLRLSRSSIASLAQGTPLPQMHDALAAALEIGDVHAATVLALSIGAAGGFIPRDDAARLLPDVDNLDHAVILAGVIDGDRLTTLLDIAEQGRLSWEREALLLFLATQLLEGAEPPRRLLTGVRTLAREPISPGAALLVGLAARALDNAEINSLAGPLLVIGESAERFGTARELMDLFSAPVLDSLTEEEGRIIGDGYTVVRSEPKVGRNDPCPCGSGRKFKKCCADKEHEAPVRHQSLVEQFQKTGAGNGKVRQRLFDQLRPGEIAHLSPDELTTLQLIQGFRNFAMHHRWEDAERFVEALMLRSDAPFGDTDGYRLELVDMSLEAGKADFAERHFKLCDLSESEAARVQVQLALARKDSSALDLLESTLTLGHREEDRGLLIDCAFALLRHSPALGILVARGCIDEERFLDSEGLLMEIDRARDRLDLPSHEPWWEIFDRLLDDQFVPGTMGSIGSPNEHRNVDRHDEIEQMRASLQAAQSRVHGLDEELAGRVAQLESLTQEREELATLVQVSQGAENQKRVSDLEAERQRLRKKIDELKGEISTGAEQRASLRRELAQAADALRQEHRDRHAEEARDPDGPDDAEGASAELRPKRILIPHFTPAASRSLADSAQRLASDALQVAALLAAGDAHAWGGVKHMRSAHDVLSARIGRSHRLLFHAAEDRLDVLELVRRRDLDLTLQRLRK